MSRQPHGEEETALVAGVDVLKDRVTCRTFRVTLVGPHRSLTFVELTEDRFRLAPAPETPNEDAA